MCVYIIQEAEAINLHCPVNRASNTCPGRWFSHVAQHQWKKEYTLLTKAKPPKAPRSPRNKIVECTAYSINNLGYFNVHLLLSTPQNRGMPLAILTGCLLGNQFSDGFDDFGPYGLERCSRWGKAKIPKVVPPYSLKGLYKSCLEWFSLRFAIQPKCRY